MNLNQTKYIIALVAFWFVSEQSGAQETDTMRLYNQHINAVEHKVLQAEERNGILVLESKDRKYKIWYDARVQVDGAYFPGNSLNPIGNGLSIRRARFALKSRFAEKWYGEIDINVSNSKLELKNAYLEFSPNKNLGIKAGNFKEGFSMARTISSKYLSFIELPNAVSTFAPSRHIGIAATYSQNWLFTTSGIYFQDIGSPDKRDISTHNNQEHGTDEGVSFTGKLVAMPYYNDPDKGLHFGVAGSYRTPKTHAETIGSEHYSTRSLTSINRKKYMDTDVIPFVDQTVLANFELAGYYKYLRFQSEYILSNVYRKNNLSTENFDGWYAFGSILLFGGHYNYSTGKGEFAQPSRGKAWGDVELLFRYDYLNLNSAKDGIMGGAGKGYTFGINYHANSNVKIMLNYAYMNHDRYANGNGSLFVGHDEAGRLTKDPQKVTEPEGEAGDDFGFMAIRFEVIF